MQPSSTDTPTPAPARPAYSRQAPEAPASASSEMPRVLRVGLAVFVTLFPVLCVGGGFGEPKYWGPERLRWVLWSVLALWALGAVAAWWYALRGSRSGQDA